MGISTFPLKSLILVFIFLKGFVITTRVVAEVNKTKSISHVNIDFGKKFTRNAKNGIECLKLIWRGPLASFNTRPLWF